MPNQEFGFAKAHASMLNFEHPSVCTNLHWIFLFHRNGFLVEEVSLYKGHSIMIAARRVEIDVHFSLQTRELSRALLDDYTRAMQDRLATIRLLADPSKQNWLFGAHNNAQVLFMYGLEEGIFQGLMDNSPLKANKRLYGTSLVCRMPAEVVGQPHLQPLRVFVNIGAYNAEVRAQLLRLDPDLECVTL